MPLQGKWVFPDEVNAGFATVWPAGRRGSSFHGQSALQPPSNVSADVRDAVYVIVVYTKKVRTSIANLAGGEQAAQEDDGM